VCAGFLAMARLNPEKPKRSFGVVLSSFRLRKESYRLIQKVSMLRRLYVNFFPASFEDDNAEGRSQSLCVG
jgi:hypothetical protein